MDSHLERKVRVRLRASKESLAQLLEAVSIRPASAVCNISQHLPLFTSPVIYQHAVKTIDDGDFASSSVSHILRHRSSSPEDIRTGSASSRC